VISVKAKMWWWEVRYRAPDGGEEIVLANEIAYAGWQAGLSSALSSDDVIHSFWVPALAGKVDTVPGRLHGMTCAGGQAPARSARSAPNIAASSMRAWRCTWWPHRRRQFQAWLAAHQTRQ
jgi:cytochrome c oxidase subunit 2